MYRWFGVCAQMCSINYGQYQLLFHSLANRFVIGFFIDFIITRYQLSLMCGGVSSKQFGMLFAVFPIWVLKLEIYGHWAVFLTIDFIQGAVFVYFACNYDEIRG